MIVYPLLSDQAQAVYGELLSEDADMVAVDLGYALIKAFGPNMTKGVSFRSVYAGRTIGSAVGLGNATMQTNTHDIILLSPNTGQEILFGSVADTVSRQYHVMKKDSDVETAAQFFQAALSRVCRPGRSKVWAVIGVTTEDARKLGFHNSMRSHLEGLHVFETQQGARYEVLVEKVMLQPQPAGAMFYATLNADGIPTHMADIVRKSRFCVVAVGGGTTEVYTIVPRMTDDGRYVIEPDYGRCGSRNGAGMGVIRAHLVRSVWKDVEERYIPSVSEIDHIILSGGRYERNVWQDYSAEIEFGRAQLAANVMTAIRDTIGADNLDIQWVFIAGGVAPLVQDDIAESLGRNRCIFAGEQPSPDGPTKVEDVEFPERIIAEGLYRYARYASRV